MLPPSSAMASAHLCYQAKGLFTAALANKLVLPTHLAPGELKGCYLVKAGSAREICTCFA